MEGSGSGRKAPYYVHRGVPSTHLEWRGPPGFQPRPVAVAKPPVEETPVVAGNGVGEAGMSRLEWRRSAANVNAPAQPNAGGGGSVKSEDAAETLAVVVHGVGEVGVSTGERPKRKRGRPRKYWPEGDALSPLSTSDTMGKKQGKGRPPGTGRKQLLASYGDLFSSSAGTCFTPHVVTVKAGEDIAARVMSFSQQWPSSICILTANGAVSKLTLRRSSSSGGSVTYEGQFKILRLAVNYALTDYDMGHPRTGGLCITVCNTDGSVIGGEITGELIAATPIQLVVGSFLSNTPMKKSRENPNTEIDMATDPPAGDKFATCNKSATSTTRLPGQALTPTSTTNASPISRHVDIRIPIDLTNG